MRKQAFTRSRFWLFLLVGILLISAFLRFTGYNFSLPYVDHPDEPNFYLAARMILDDGSAKRLDYQGYPPGIIAIFSFFQRNFQQPDESPASFLWLVRLIAISASLGVLVLSALIGYQIRPPISALIIALISAFIPVIILNSRYASADNFVAFFTLLAIWFVLLAINRDSDTWATAAVVSMMIAILFKYQAVFVAPVIWLAPLWRLRSLESSEDRRRILLNFARNTIYLGLFGFWLVFLTPALEANDIPNWVAPDSRLGIPSLITLEANFRGLLAEMGIAEWFWLLSIAGFLCMIIPKIREQVRPFSLLVVALAGIGWWFGVSFYGIHPFRQFITLSAILLILQGVGIACWILLIIYLLERYVNIFAIRYYARVIAPTLVILLLMPGVIQNFGEAQLNTIQHTYPDRRNDLATYMDTSLEPAPHIATWANHKTLNPDWGGYAGINQFPFVAQADITHRSIEEWREMGVEYAIVPYSTYYEDPAMQPYKKQTLLLKEFPPEDEMRGPSMVVLRLHPIQNELSASLGSITYIGYDISETSVRPGETITFRLYWNASEAPPGDLQVFNHLMDGKSIQPIAQADGMPLFDARRPTSLWNDPAETLVSQEFTLQLPEDVAIGRYTLVSGFYDQETGERLTDAEGNDRAIVTRINITNTPNSTSPGIQSS